MMFNTQYRLQQRVIDYTKTESRRIEKCLAELPTNLGDYDSVIPFKDGDKFIVRHYWKAALIKEFTVKPKFKVGEVVAVARPYKEILDNEDFCTILKENGLMNDSGWLSADLITSEGYRNKMYVRAEYMPNHIEITNVRIERLQDITDADIFAEGVYERKDVLDLNLDRVTRYTFGGTPKLYKTPREAYAALIDAVGKKGTWKRNPWVVAYTFKRVR